MDGENVIYEMIQLTKLQDWQIFDSGMNGIIDMKSITYQIQQI